MQEPITRSILTCPYCGHCQEEEMPLNACQLFYECPGCEVLMTPKPGDCCVFCSFGNVPCPSRQAGDSCCDGD